METPTKETIKYLADQLNRSAHFVEDEAKLHKPSLEVLAAHATVASVASCAILQLIQVVRLNQ